MTKRPRKLDKPDRAPRKASSDEKELWSHVTSDIRPLQVNQAQHPIKRPKLLPGRPFDPLPNRPLASVPARRFYPDAAAIDALSERTPGLDRKTAKSLMKGERAPEARVDLHGMTLERAHGELRRFILVEQARGARCVLVITGKGGDYRSRADGRYEMESRGALKRDVPRWLREPALSGAVIGIYQAHTRHGGEGALYVYLRRPR